MPEIVIPLSLEESYVVHSTVYLSDRFFILQTPQVKGWLGEFTVKLIVGKDKPSKKRVINNLKLRIDDGKTAQVDHVVINEKGVFVIETKNYSGRIYGRESHLEWTQVLNYGKVKNKLYNPIKQNKTHIYYISKFLPEAIPINSIVVFVRGNTQYINADGVYTLGELKSALLQNNGTTLSPKQIEETYMVLSNANDSSITNQEHIQNIYAMQQNITNDFCPRCGKKLTLRHGKNGGFMGCTGYPNCKFTKRI